MLRCPNLCLPDLSSMVRLSASRPYASFLPTDRRTAQQWPKVRSVLTPPRSSRESAMPLAGWEFPRLVRNLRRQLSPGRRGRRRSLNKVACCWRGWTTLRHCPCPEHRSRGAVEQQARCSRIKLGGTRWRPESEMRAGPGPAGPAGPASRWQPSQRARES